MVVYSIIPSDEASDCTFVGADGTVSHITGGQQDILPQTQVSVTCLARSGPVVTPTGFPNFTSFFPTLQTVATTASVTSANVSSTTGSVSTSTTTPSAAGSSTIPPYPIVTGSSTTTGATGASVSAPSSAPTATGGLTPSPIVPFTSNAVRAAQSIGSSLLAFVGLLAVL